jgi:hypothetical protein
MPKGTARSPTVWAVSSALSPDGLGLLDENRFHEEQPASNVLAQSSRNGRRFMLPCTEN